MGHLVCEKCKSYYELKEGESPDDFIDECNCGGKLRYAENIDIVSPDWNQAPINDICPKCGAKTPSGATFCATCNTNVNDLDKI
ncbi:MAG TPA: hypothetical protein VK444_01045 [Methanobacteriaceae archaeon]|nr:hypothetical protein [Methanobacteriaceae archaeon]